ncbi:MAG: toxin TcdB middle/N-terminal domain-containing protein, partial [Verrucomicrobiota bacterium]
MKIAFSGCLICLGSATLLAASAEKSGVGPQAISLPSGPGSVEGLGESFEPQLNSGTFVYRFPLKLPPVRGGAPEISLEYNSGHGNGWLGLGWRLALPFLQRQTDKGLPLYTETDSFVDWTGEELIRQADGTFRQENEFAFTRYEQTTGGGWLGRLRNGVTLWFGQSGNSRLSWSTNGAFAWHVEASQDPNGNRVEYRYRIDAGQLYPEEIRYGLHAAAASKFYRVAFEYDDARPDPVVDYGPRFRSETRLRLASVTVFLEERRVRQWRLAYHTNASLSLLASVTLFGDERSRTNESAEPNRDFLPPTVFHYGDSRLGFGWALLQTELPELINFSNGLAEIVDINRDGLPDVLFERNSVLRTFVNAGPNRPWNASRRLENPPVGTDVGLGQPLTRLVDLRGDGRSKLMVLHQRASVGGTSTFRFQDFLRPDQLTNPLDYLAPDTLFPDDSRVRFVDLNHDKAIDLLRIDEGAFSRVTGLITTPAGDFTNATVRGLVPGSDISFALGWQLADMNGDRLQDLVLLGGNNNTWVCLNSGYARFESRHQIPGAPSPDVLQEGAGAQLIDIDQDGLADLVIVDNRRVRIWPNLAGRQWGRVVTISDPRVPAYRGESTAVRFADFNGNGSTDIIWNEPNTSLLQVLDLNPAGKAWLLNRVATTLGRTLEVSYRSSTDFMVEAAGTTNEWTSTAPFPIPVVAQIVESDGLGNSYTNQFTYRNAYYDGLEREFRGFEQAERREIGDEAQGAPTLVTEFRFDTGFQIEALKGKPLEVLARDDSGGIFWRETNQWSARVLPITKAPGEARTNTFAFRRVKTTEVRERLPENQAVWLKEEFDYDDFGNQTRHTDWGRLDPGDPFWDDERVTVRAFSAAHPSGQSLWLLDRLVTEELQDEAGAVVTRKHYFYDDETFAGDNLGAVSKGNLTLVREWIDPGSTNAIEAARFRLAVRNHYDPFGNVIGTLDPLGAPGRPESGHQRRVEFDAALHTYPVRETIYTANPLVIATGEPAPRLEMSADYDLGLGVLRRATDFNGNETRFDFDAFGRLIAITKPGDTPELPTSTFDYRFGDRLADGRTINWIETRLRELAGGAGAFDSRSYFDGLGRQIMTRTESERPGEVVVNGATVFNQRRSPWKTVLPYFEPGTLDFQPPDYDHAFTETHYDALGRSARVVQPATSPDGRRAFSRTTYA